MKVVLVRPETPGNVGAVARVMLNFGFEDLVLVDPCEIDEEARKRAKHADSVLEDADVWKEMGWEKFDLVVGTTSETAGEYNVRRNALKLGELKERIQKVDGEIALVFGPEGEGLLNEEIKRCDLLCKIPTSEKYPTMNLSHSAGVVLYELSKEGEGDEIYELAGKELKGVLMEKLGRIVDEADVEEYRKEKIFLSLKNVFGRGMISSREANTLIGFFRKLEEKL